MGITQQIGASSLIRPGVIDNTAARPASPYEGQCIFQKDTDQLLVWNGTAWVIPNQTTTNPEGLELITTGSLTSTATNFVGCFSSSYSNYLIVMDSLLTSGAADFYFQFLNGTTPNASADYFWAYTGYRSDGVASDSAFRGFTMGYTGMTITAASQVLGSSHLQVFTPNVSGQRSFVTSHNWLYQSEWGHRTGGSHFNQTNSFDGIRFLTNSATGFAGNVRIYGYRNS